jgi:spermidine/putrescine transport system substrate-binding protein
VPRSLYTPETGLSIPGSTVNRRAFLGGAALLGGATLLSGCGSPDVETPNASASHPPIEQEPGQLSILEWGGYEAAGTKAQTYGLVGGKDYTDKFGANGISYTYIDNDDQAFTKAQNDGHFDLMHPCSENLPEYVDAGIIQPWDTSLLPSFDELNPELVKAGQVDGKQYLIPWDWGYASLMYRSDMVDEADATGWELAWNPKYKDKISLWNGGPSNFEIAGMMLGFPDVDNQTDDQIAQSKAKLLEQKPLNKFYWDSEYSDMRPAFKSGTIWITYSWQAAYAYFKDKGMKVAYMDPSQGRLAWLCGFTLGTNTKNYFHAHDYVESFINKPASLNLVNLYAYGASNTAIDLNKVDDQLLVDTLHLDNPNAITSDNVHLQSYMPNRAKIDQAWTEITA